MTLRTLLVASIALAAAGAAPAAFAQDVPAAVQARQGLMQLQALNLGVVGNMARGNTVYDADAAMIAANNLVTLSRIDQSFHWPDGTDNATIEGTRALPAIWDDMAELMQDFQDFGVAAEGLAAVAGDGLDALRPAVGSVGQTCGACHDAYRQSQ